MEDRTFSDAVEPFRGALRLHCYRMLGSAHDSEDLVQESMLRAWRARESLKDLSAVRPWLYRIATNACLDELKRRPRRGLAPELYPPGDPSRPPTPPVEEPVFLEPMPDRWLIEEESPAARYAMKESVALAFVAALHVLSAVQRATLLLRDVVGLSAEETAEALELSVSAANSALFRARSAIEEKLLGRPAGSFLPPPADPATVSRYVEVFEAADLEALIAMLHQEVRTMMPPSPTWIEGKAANIVFYRRMLASVSAGWYRHRAIGANGQTAFGFYRPTAPGAPHRLHAIQLVEFREGQIYAIDHFMMPALVAMFGLPEVWSDAPG
ncbi:MAG: RNA polymerase subunit sigma-70 [Myxococcota bacterium]